MTEKSKAVSVLTVNTLSFIVCFACWMLYGVLITFLVDNGVFNFDKSQMGILIGTPVLTGSIVRLPVGVWTDRYGGRIVFSLVMIVSAIAMYMVSYCNTFNEFLLAGLGFGLCGTSFAVGIAYTSIWFPKERQGTVLGIFGAGNAGAAITSFGAPLLLNTLTNNGQNLDGWRSLPKLYAGILILTCIIFWLGSHPKKIEHGAGFTLMQQLAPLKYPRVWRFGLYYFFVFGGFVALSQWLIPYYLNVYGMSLATAGLMASIFSLPSGVIRAFGGWLSDLFGARKVMYWVLGSCLVACILLCVPRMDIMSPGEGVMAIKKGVVTRVDSSLIEVDGRQYFLKTKKVDNIITVASQNESMLVLPTFTFWQEPVVQVNDKVQKKQLMARGVTHIFFQANVWIFTALVLIVGVATGIGKSAVYKHIPDYFPKDVGVVGGIVGVIGGLGGWIGPILFGFMLNSTGIWTSCWLFFTIVIIVCLGWMHLTITHMMNQQAPEISRNFESVK
ncbi:NarK/NasA family nitrate transporter [bacterium]|nr:NarK/NasA family nitrate transporter [bacterium]QQR56771.1 MAG: NarK/NasA family nitrate transporter [Candidatus Melainabacteria bacterium]